MPTLERQKIFDEVCRLRQSKGDLGVPTLRSLLEARFSRIPSRETLRRWLAGETAPTTSMNRFEPKPSEELSFFLGAWLGDGWADDTDGGKRLLLKVRSFDFAQEFARSATRVLSKSKPYRVRIVNGKTGSWFVVKATSVLLYDFVNRPFSELTAYIESNPMGFLRAFFTAEGNPSVSIQQSARNQPLAVSICVSNTNMEYMMFTRNQLMRLGYDPSGITTGYKAGVSHPIRGVCYTAKETEWQFRIVRLGEVEKFLSQIGFADNVKQEKASTAFRLVKKYGAFTASSYWAKNYAKINRKWVRITGSEISSLP